MRHVDLDLQAAARFNAELTVTVVVEQVKKASLVFTQQVVGADGTLHCQARVKAACVDKDAMKAVAIPDSILQAIKAEVS